MKTPTCPYCDAGLPVGTEHACERFMAALESARQHPFRHAMAEAVRQEAAHWKEQALRHCNRADRAEAAVERLKSNMRIAGLDPELVEEIAQSDVIVNDGSNDV